jgi:hypothetical protein
VGDVASIKGKGRSLETQTIFRRLCRGHRAWFLHFLARKGRKSCVKIEATTKRVTWSNNMRGTFLTESLFTTCFGTACALIVLPAVPANAQALPSIITSQLPSSAVVGTSLADRAMVSGGISPTGTVTFNLFNNATGTGTPLFTDTEPLGLSGMATSAGFTATSVGTDYWGHIQRRQQQ